MKVQKTEEIYFSIQFNGYRVALEHFIEQCACVSKN